MDIKNGITIALSTLATLVIGSTLVACGGGSSTPCADESGNSALLESDVHLGGADGFHETETADPNSVDLRLLSEPAQDDLILDLYVMPQDAWQGAQPLRVHADRIAAANGAQDLAALGAKGCYCPSGATANIDQGTYVTDLSCNDANGRTVQPTCEILNGTVTIANLHKSCVGQNEMNDYGGTDCVLAYDLVLDVPQSSGRVWLHMHQTSSLGLDHHSCQTSSGGGGGSNLLAPIGFVPN